MERERRKHLKWRDGEEGRGKRKEEEIGKVEARSWPLSPFPGPQGIEAVDEAVRFYYEFPKLSLVTRSFHFVFICFSCELSAWL